MAPDLNSLPPSRISTSFSGQISNMQQTSPTSPTPQASLTRQPTSSSSPRSRSTSLAAAATMNAADRSRRSSSSYQTRASPQLQRIPSNSDRLRSQVSNTLSLNDPALPSPGELSTSGGRRTSIGNAFSAASSPALAGRGAIATGDPHHHHRAPSLGDIHNELEQEQEAQVNRMLQMIRLQQHQLDQLQQAQQENSGTSNISSGDRRNSLSGAASATVADTPTPSSERSISFTRPVNRSRNPSNAARSPAMRALSTQDSHASNAEWSPLDTTRRNSIRDESAYYQAETANLTRENQMLKHRIRELEKQLAELHEKPVNSPNSSSNLATSPVVGGQPSEITLGRPATQAK